MMYVFEVEEEDFPVGVTRRIDEGVPLEVVDLSR